ncbi:ECF-type sigma factor [Chiayiivirga flava]|uniref:RNA polymerase sigma factor (TIGR02999 family) n=1 Tax=Chiayiivirga flava TaxID=659595 RepID=A0A7W8G0A2_9GAMM|nr:RNA polymerase sigma factor (TIGR02999 family) [Chiayiivirga flava]
MTSFNAEQIIDALSASPADPERRKHALGVVYNELVKIARAELAKHRRGATLDTRGLVNEAYLKLFGGSPRVYENRKHFYATAAVAMRQVVIDYARQRLAERRGGGKRDHASLEGLEGEPLAIDAEAERLVQIDMALTRLSQLDERLVQIVEMRFFGGLEVTEIADLLGVSEATIKRDTRAARAFLERELEPDL